MLLFFLLPTLDIDIESPPYVNSGGLVAGLHDRHSVDPVEIYIVK